MNIFHLLIVLFLRRYEINTFFVRRQRIALLIALVALASACNPARRLSDDQYLLNKNKIIIDNASVSKDDLQNLQKQKPNRKILGLFRFHLWFYNTVDKEKTERKKAEWVIRTEKKNEIRKAKGKKEIDTDKEIFREKLLSIGEEPAILDSSLIDRTKRQFELYLFRKGFFHATISDTIHFKKNHQANVTYSIHCNQPYLVRNISYSSRDAAISYYLKDAQTNSLIRQGDNYDEDKLELERQRITNELRNNGYYFFNKNYITYDPDSSLNSHEVDIYLYVNKINENVDQGLNLNLSTEDHQQWRLNNIYIQTDYLLKEPNAIPKDTTFFNDCYFLSRSGTEAFRKEAILRAIFIKRGDLFKQADLDYTYNRLLDLSVFRFIKIVFTKVDQQGNHQNNLLDVFLQLSPVPKQDYTFETEATQTGGNLGLAGSFGYRNKNTFRGAEQVEFKLKGALEALRNFNDSDQTKKLLFFNTYEIGPEINMNVKRFVPGFIERGTSRYANPRTNFSVSFNYQDRPDFTRRILNFSSGWVWNSPNGRQLFNLYPVNFYSVNVNLSDRFNEKLKNSRDQSLINSYKTHLTPGGRASWVISNQSIRPFRSFAFLRVNLEWAGWIVAPAVNKAFKYPDASDGTKTIFNVTYAQFLKPDFDFSFHQRLNLHNTMVYRVAAGIGIEGPNSSALPFEKSFFGGGANSLRAWQARTLGPGSYKNTSNIEQTGDMKIETNIELRSSLFKILEGALFMDAGNIWTRHLDAERPGSQFDFGNILDETAIGVGAGLRLNFSFFILRVDLATKIHDPELDIEDRWVYSNQKLQLKDWTLNLAIGYPF